MASIITRMDAEHRPPSTILYAALWFGTFTVLLAVVGLAPVRLQQGMVCLAVALSAACVISDVVLRQHRPCPYGLATSLVVSLAVVTVLSSVNVLSPTWRTSDGMLLVVGATICGGGIAHIVRTMSKGTTAGPVQICTTSTGRAS